MEIYSDFYQMFNHTSFLSSPLPSFSSSLLHLLLLLISSSFLTLSLILFHLPSFLFPLHPPSLFPLFSFLSLSFSSCNFIRNGLGLSSWWRSYRFHLSSCHSRYVCAFHLLILFILLIYSYPSIVLLSCII